MAKNKLKKFAENLGFNCLVQAGRNDLGADNHPLKGKWRSEFFKNNLPIVLELGCGKGEYTVAMSQRFSDKNFIGIDVKGARLNYGAKQVENLGITHAGFLRTEIEILDQFFEPGEVSEIWITFPDPQIKHKRAKHRLLNPSFLNIYKQILDKEGLVHLKTDSEFLHGYTCGILHYYGADILEAYFDIDKQVRSKNYLLHEVQTHYESLFRGKGKTITYLKFKFL